MTATQRCLGSAAWCALQDAERAVLMVLAEPARITHDGRVRRIVQRSVTNIENRTEFSWGTVSDACRNLAWRGLAYEHRTPSGRLYEVTPAGLDAVGAGVAA